MNESSASPNLWELPDVLLFHVVTFLAAPTRRAAILCRIASLCKDAQRSILLDEENRLWDLVLKEDYGSVVPYESDSRRVCKRLKRSPVHRVRDAHRLIRDNTEIAFFYLSEMTAASKKSLTKTKMCRIFAEYGPYLRFNNLVSSGGLFLVEVCRARHVKETVVLRCVQELVENRGVLVDLLTHETANSRQTALCVAAVRAMPTVVKYLLQKGASPLIRSSGRFRLYKNSKKTLRCTDVTPLEFSTAMLDAEREAGASQRETTGLARCIRLLERT